MTQMRPVDPAGQETLCVALHHAAHGRTGDKGNRSNISVVAWHPDLWPLLLQQVTESVVAKCFEGRSPSSVRRYVLPRLHAMNFVIDDVLDGGVNDALNLDSHGKSLSFLLLDMSVEVPTALRHRLVGAAELVNVLPRPIALGEY
jgi:hypothetical protein